MKSIFFLFILLSACAQKTTDLSQQAAEEIRKADLAMSDMAIKEGFHKTLLQYSDDNVVKPQEGELPVIGKSALAKYWAEKKEIKEISWEPFKTEASQSGDLGYSLGNWKYVTADSTFYGNYYTIWKKQADGSWKFVVDGGNNTPSPPK